MSRLRAGPLAGALAALALATSSAAQASPSDDAFKMGSPAALPQGVEEEQMWPAATAEQWQLPVLVPWQRTWADALRVAQETERPILVCVNMDGEIASEHYAGIRYREVESAKLLEPFVCVIASVYRHAPRDHDAQGQRVPCPRFGGVTCGEHIAMESLLYERFFDGKRIAPRHILVELDGRETYDVYYSWDTATVFTAWRKGAENRPPPKPRAGDLPLVERSASADGQDRLELERAYLRGSREVRRALLEATLTLRDLDQTDLLRLAIFGLDVDLARLARKALAQSRTEGAIELIAEVLKSPLEAGERAELLAAAARLAEAYPQARTLVAVHQGLSASSRFVDLEGWASGAAGASYADAVGLDGRAAAFEAQPEDPEAKLGLAEALLARAMDPATEPRFAEVFLADAREQIRAAQRLGAQGWRLDALLALDASARGERDEALTRAQAAIEGGMPRPGEGASSESPGVDERTAVQVLALFAQARQRGIARAYREREPWPSEWLADVTSVYAVLAQHPLGTDGNLADGYDFLCWLGATPRAMRMLEDGLTRFPESWILHERLRARLLWERGPEGLEASYSERLTRSDAAPAEEWFAAYASLVAAEHHRRAGAPEKALLAYERALVRYERDAAARPEHAESAEHYAAMAQAGRARIELERGELAAATSAILASFERSPAAGATLDGLNLSPVGTAKMLLARLDEAGEGELAAGVRGALAELDPRLLELPDYERQGTRAGGR